MTDRSTKIVETWDSVKNILSPLPEYLADEEPTRFTKNPDTTILDQTPNYRVDSFKIEGNIIVRKTRAELVVVNAARAARLELHKEAAFAIVDQKVGTKINQGGFEFPTNSGNIFSITTQAQVFWLGVYTSKDSLTYPIIKSTKDDRTAYSISDATVVGQMHARAVRAVRSYLDESVSVKKLVNRATTEAEVDSLVGNY